MLNTFQFDWLPAGRILPPGDYFLRPTTSRTHDATVEDGEYHWVLFVYPPGQYSRNTLFQWNCARFHSQGPGKGFPAPGWATSGQAEGRGEAASLEEARSAVESWFVTSYTKARS